MALTIQIKYLLYNKNCKLFCKIYNFVIEQIDSRNTRESLSSNLLTIPT